VVYDPAKDLLSDHDSFAAEFWFTPAQYLDYLSLIGDSSDNVPGVSGIWPKTALDLIQRFWSLDNIYTQLHEVSAGTAEKLRVGQLQGQESKQLITLMDVPDLMHRTLQEFPREPDFGRIATILVDQYHLHSLEWLIHTLKKQRQGGEQLSLFW
jgi:5'-3' exonuclease